MEIKSLHEAIEAIMKEQEIDAYFSPEQIEKVSVEMVKIMEEVLGGNELQAISFHEDEKMFFDLNNNSVHLGLGILKRMVNTWFEIETGGGSVYMPPDVIRERVLASLRSDAAHEAGHRVIELHPIKELGFSQEEWGSLGISSLANAGMDCRNDGRIMLHHPDLKSDMEAGLEFAFGPDGRLDWPSKLEQHRLESGFDVLFSQFDAEAIRYWAYGQIHAATDPRVRALLQKHAADILFLANDKTCVPSKRPSDLEKRAKAKKAYAKIVEINQGDYQQVLIPRDRDNQAVHQGVSIVGLFKNGQDFPEKLREFLEQKLNELPPAEAVELEQQLQKQRDAKITYESQKKPVEAVVQQQGEALKKATEVSAAEQVETALAEANVSAGAPAPLTAASAPMPPAKSTLDLLGPAVLVEELSEPLRDFLKKLLGEAMELMKEEIMQQLLEKFLQELLKNPEKILKEIEDALNEQLRPHTKPPMVPNHEEMEQEPPPPLPLPPTLNVGAGGSGGLNPIETDFKPTPRELEKTEKWLEENLDLPERVAAWREAIYAVVRGRKEKTKKPKPRLYGPELVRDEIRKQMGAKTTGKIFLDTRAEKQDKITLSVLWRTSVVPLEEALKLILFLVKIASDDEIKQYLDLEILISQQVPGVGQNESDSPVPIVMAFGDDAIADYEKIITNLLSLQKSSQTGGRFPIVQDATALRTQRERLLAQNPGGRRKFAIDLWDAAAVERGVENPMAAVKKEIAETQETLHGKAFCFLMTGSKSVAQSSPAHAYGEANFLAETSAERLIRYLDVVVRTMIEYPDSYAPLIKEQIGKELGIYLP